MYTFLYTNVLFAALLIPIVWICFDQFQKLPKNVWLISVVCTGVAPVLTTIFLYYLLAITPHHSNLFYQAIISILFFLLFLSGLFLRPKLNSKILIKFTAIFSLTIIAYSVLHHYRMNFLEQKLVGHDALMYGGESRALYEDKDLRFKYDPNYKLFDNTLVPKHFPSYSLLHTWESIINDSAQKDDFFLGINSWYFLLLTALGLITLYYLAPHLMWFYPLLLMSSFICFKKMFQFPIDNFRIYFYLLSLGVTVLLCNTRKVSYRHAAIVGLTSGLAAATHSIGLLTSLIQVGYLSYQWVKERADICFLKIFTIIMLSICFGSIHYLVDIFFGSGWIL